MNSTVLGNSVQSKSVIIPAPQPQLPLYAYILIAQSKKFTCSQICSWKQNKALPLDTTGIMSIGLYSSVQIGIIRRISNQPETQETPLSPQCPNDIAAFQNTSEDSAQGRKKG